MPPAVLEGMKPPMVKEKASNVHLGPRLFHPDPLSQNMLSLMYIQHLVEWAR